MNKNDLIEILSSQETKILLSELWIIHLYLVWSFSRWENTENSDIDLIYEKNKNIRIWWIKFIKNKTVLEKKLNKKIDLVNLEYVYKNLKPYLENDKILIY